MRGAAAPAAAPAEAERSVTVRGNAAVVARESQVAEEQLVRGAHIACLCA